MKKAYIIIFIIFCLIFSFSFVNFTNEFYPSYSLIDLPSILKDYTSNTWYSFKNIGSKSNNISNLFTDNREYVFNYLKDHDTDDLRFMISTYVSKGNFNITDIEGFIRTNDSIYRSLKESKPKDILLDGKEILIEECKCIDSMLKNYYNYCITSDVNYINNGALIYNNVLSPIIKEKHKIFIKLFEDIGMEYEVLESGTLRYGYTKHKPYLFNN